MAGIRLVPTVNSDGSIDINVVGGTLDAGDIEIGAVEIKNSSDDTRAAVGVNGLAVDVKALPTLPAGTNAIGKLAANSGVDIGDVDVTSLPELPAGTNAIGKLAANSGVDIGDVDVTSLPATPAGTNLIGKIAAALQTDAIMNGATALTPKFIFANVAASQTDANIVTAVTSKKIRVLAVLAVQGATASAGITFNSKGGGAGTAISALFAAGANNGFAAGFNPAGWFETASGEALTVTTGAGATVGIQVVYVEV